MKPCWASQYLIINPAWLRIITDIPHGPNASLHQGCNYNPNPVANLNPKRYPNISLLTSLRPLPIPRPRLNPNPNLNLNLNLNPNPSPNPNLTPTRNPNLNPNPDPSPYQIALENVLAFDTFDPHLRQVLADVFLRHGVPLHTPGYPYP